MNMYKVYGQIGQGAHGVVMKAVHIRSNREVALKRIHYRRQSRDIPVHILREIMCLKLVDHQFVVQLLDVFMHSLNFVLVFDFMPASLSDIIHDDENVLNEAQVKAYMLMLLKGIAYIHDLKIMHRDLKPANVLIDKNGILKIADFGLGRLLFSNTSVCYSHQVATRWYRAPELLYSATHYDVGVDLWALGCIFAEMINRSPLFPGENDIEQLALVIHTLGTPTEETWPGLTSLPDYNKILFPESAGTPFTTLVPDSSPHIVDLISRWLSYNSALRPPAKEAVYNRYFFKSPMPCSVSQLPKPRPDHHRKCIFRSESTLFSGTYEIFEDLRELVSYSDSPSASSTGLIDSNDIAQMHASPGCSSAALISTVTDNFKTRCHKSMSSGSMRVKRSKKTLRHRSAS